MEWKTRAEIGLGARRHYFYWVRWDCMGHPKVAGRGLLDGSSSRTRACVRSVEVQPTGGLPPPQDTRRASTHPPIDPPTTPAVGIATLFPGPQPQRIFSRRRRPAGAIESRNAWIKNEWIKVRSDYGGGMNGNALTEGLCCRGVGKT